MSSVPLMETRLADSGMRAREAGLEPNVPEAVLVVEDDEDVRRITVRILKNLGYEVRTAKDAPSALRVLAGHGVGLVLSDVVFPSGMSGLDLARELNLRHPGVKVLLTSGYPDWVTGTDAISENQVAFIAKPYRREQLAEKVKTLLDR